jgi:hypothetical protein
MGEVVEGRESSYWYPNSAHFEVEGGTEPARGRFLVSSQRCALGAEATSLKVVRLLVLTVGKALFLLFPQTLLYGTFLRQPSLQLWVFYRLAPRNATRVAWERIVSVEIGFLCTWIRSESRIAAAFDFDALYSLRQPRPASYKVWVVVRTSVDCREKV